MSGKCQGNLNFFKVRELLGNSLMCQGKMIFCKIFQPDEAGMFGPNVSFAKFIKFSAPILSGKFEFVSGNCQGILVSLTKIP